MKPTREQAYALLIKYNTSQALIHHALAVEAVMRHYAAKFGEDVEKWGVIGLLHDLDYQLYPEQHCQKVVELLKKKGLMMNISAPFRVTVTAFARMWNL